jgi:hypothetical protein
MVVATVMKQLHHLDHLTFRSAFDKAVDEL